MKGRTNMKTHALKALSPRRSTGTGVPKARATMRDPLGAICARHRDNPFVRFLRVAFFYDDEQARGAAARVPDRTPPQKTVRGSLRGPLQGSLKF